MTIDLIEPVASRREQRKLDRRQAIVAAARKSFLEDGYAATSMSGLLSTLGGSKATLWTYFRSKEELFAAVIEDITMAFRIELRGELSLAGDIEPTLVGFCRSFMQKISTPDAVATWRLVVAESGRFPEVGRIFYDRAARQTQAVLADYLAHQITAGRLRDENPTKMAEMLTSLCVTEQTRLLWGLASPDAGVTETSSVEYTRWFLRAFAPAGAASRNIG